MKSILITGGCGFIGSHTCLSLLKSKYNLIVIDSNINSSDNVIEKIIQIGKLENVDYRNRITFIKGDIRNIDLLNNIFSESIKNDSRIEAVIHLAGLKSVAKSFKEPLEYWDNNVMGSLSLLKIMSKFDCFTMVFSSSATVYELKNKGLLTEDSDLKPCNPYGETKLAVEKILHDTYRSTNKNWRIINLRYFNPIGAHSTGLIGESPLGLPDNLFPFICEVAAKKVSTLNIFGDDWPTFDGTCIRDYIHVMDLADAHLSALQFLFKNKPQILSLNIGTGLGTSVLQLVNIFIKTNTCKVPIKFVDRRKGDLPFIVAENKLAKNILHWQPNRDLTQMCRDGWEWYQKNSSKIL
tara:strand:+ start:1853 stop:2908 length:1056 start_codon:yes stop_codon:yes gene_type:complete